MIPISLKKIIDSKNKEIQEIITLQKAYRPVVKISVYDFSDIMKLNIKKKMIQTNDNYDFIFDKFNKPLFRQLYYHLTNDKRFEGDLNKGIWLYGSTGVGKSTILEAFSYTIGDLTDKHFVNIHSKEIDEKIISFGYSFFDRRPLYIDDAGREIKELNIFGNKTIPMVEIIQRRERNGAFTLATSNVIFEDIKFSMWSDGKHEKTTYGIATIRRAKKLFNEIELKGPDRTR